MSPPLLEVKDRKVEFKLHGQGHIKAVDGISFSVRNLVSAVLVGESGSGKFVTGQAILRTLPSSARITSGEILFNGPANTQTPPIEVARL